MKLRKTAGVLALTAAALILAACAGTPKDKAPEYRAEGPSPEKSAAETKAEWTSVAFAESLAGLVSNRDFEGALALFDAVPAEKAGDPDIRKLKLSLLVSAGRLEEGKGLCSELEAELPEDTEVLYAGAVLASAGNERSKRLDYLNRILKIEPGNSAALTDLGNDFLSRKGYAQAKTNFLKALSSDASNVDAMLGLARTYYMTDDLPKARDTLNLAVSKEENYSVLWAERARVLSELGQHSDAIADIERAVALDPQIYGQWIDYGNYLLPTDRRNEALKAFSAAIELEPDQYLAYIYRAGLRDETGDREGAASDYRNVVRLYPRYFYASEGLGIILWEKGEYAGAAASFQEALSYAPKNAYYALMTVLSLYRSGNDADAKAFMSKYLATLNRDSTDYFLCRLFVDKAGDAEVINRIMKEKNGTTRSRYLFYAAEWFDLFSNKNVAQKYYVEVLSNPNPGFYEYRLSQTALKVLGGDPETGAEAEGTGLSQTNKG